MSVLESHKRCAETIFTEYKRRRAKICPAIEVNGNQNSRQNLKDGYDLNMMRCEEKQYDKYIVQLGANHMITQIHKCKLKLVVWKKYIYDGMKKVT